MLFVALIFVVVGLIFSLVLLLGALVLTVVGTVPLMLRDRHSRSLFQGATALVAWARGRAAGRHTSTARPPGPPGPPGPSAGRQ